MNRFLLSFAVFAAAFGAPVHLAATSPDLGKTPQVLLLHRADLLPGKAADYAAKESEIVQAYQSADVPVYWVALQSITGPPHVLYFDGYDNFTQVEAAATAISRAAQSNPDLGRLQSELAQSVQSAQTILHIRREDLSYRLDKFDIVKYRYVRISTYQLRSGYEQDFAQAVLAIRRAYEANSGETPWAIFQVHTGMQGPTFIAVQLLTSMKEFDDVLEARKFGYETPLDFTRSRTPLLAKDAIAFTESNLYSVNLRLSHIQLGNSARLLAPSAKDKILYPRVGEENPIPGTTMENHRQGRN